MDIMQKKPAKSSIGQYAFYFLVVLIWTQTIILQYVRAVLIRLPLIGAYADVLIFIVFAIAIIASFSQYKLSLPDLFFLLTVIIVFLLEWMFYKDGQEYLSHYAVDYLLKILPLYIVGVSIPYFEDKEKLYRLLYYLSILTLLFDIIYRQFIAEPMTDVESLYRGNMELAYNLLPHCCFIAWFAVKKTNVLNVVLSIVGVFYLLMLGTRGAALLYLLFIATTLIIGKNSKAIIVRVIVIFGSICIFLNSSWYTSSLMWLETQAKRFGLSVRIFEKLLTGGAMESVGRDKIRDTLLNAVAEKPLFGYGICGDRVLIGGYAHNIVIELWVDFGIIIGTAILAVLLIVLIRGYLKAEGDGEKGVILSMFFSSFCMMFFSGSYLHERLPLLLLGLCVSSIRISKRNSI